MDKEKILKIFTDTKALLKGHFVLSSGLHSNEYFQCALVLQHPHHCELLSKELAKEFKKDSITCVVGPALGGVTLAYEVARHLKVRGIFAERKDGEMLLRRGFKVEKNDRVLVVEDVITTGGSVKEVIELVKGFGADVVACASIVDRSKAPVDFGVLYHSLLKMEVAVYSPESCPLCKQGIPAIKPGSKQK